jgi:hypothetical protein
VDDSITVTGADGVTTLPGRGPGRSLRCRSTRPS